MAGMQNVILHPRAVLGVQEALRLDVIPGWENNIDVSLIYGSAQTGTGRTGEDVQEVRGQWFSLYPLYQKDGVLRFNTGLYGELAAPLHRYTPFLVPASGSPYAVEENERLDRQTLLGADFNLRFDYDRLHSDFHNVLYGYGHRLGPNLLAYTPVLGLDWRTRAALIGDSERPKLDFYTNLRFYFARKNGTALFNTHDALGGTKREFDLSYGLAYHFDRNTESYVEASSANNLNRGGDTSKPQDFRDGFQVGIRHSF
jgi:hypothetical protein